MISPRFNAKNKIPFNNPLKLPEIPSRKQIQSVKKYLIPTPDLPGIKNHNSKKHLSINKQNKSENSPQNALQRKHTIEDEVKARLQEVQNAEKLVKNVLGEPQATFQLGGDMTNFQHKIQLNRELIRRHRNQNQLRGQAKQNGMLVKKEVENDAKIKSVSSKQIPSNQSKQILLLNDFKLKMMQNDDIENLHPRKDSQSLEVKDLNRLVFKSERKQKVPLRIKMDEDKKVFKSIKDIFQDPQKIAQQVQNKRLKQVRFTIQELENRLKKMENQALSKSKGEEIGRTQNHSSDHKMVTAKSVGMIPISNPSICDQRSFKNWNKFQICYPSKNDIDPGCRQVKHCQSDFQNEINQIQRLQMKSYKSIQKMVQNKKLLIDLRLISAKNSSGSIKQRKPSKRVAQL